MSSQERDGAVDLDELERCLAAEVGTEFLIDVRPEHLPAWLEYNRLNGMLRDAAPSLIASAREAERLRAIVRDQSTMHRRVHASERGARVAIGEATNRTHRWEMLARNAWAHWRWRYGYWKSAETLLRSAGFVDSNRGEDGPFPLHRLVRSALGKLECLAAENERLRALQEHTLRRVELEQERGARLYGALRDIVGAWICDDGPGAYAKRMAALKRATTALSDDDAAATQPTEGGQGG